MPVAERVFCSSHGRFGDYRKDDTASFALHENMAFFPQFMFNLRRSQFVQARPGPLRCCMAHVSRVA